MKLKFCFLTPEQEKSQAENRTYTASDREALGLLVNGIYDLIRVLELYALEDQDGEIDHLTTFQTLKHLTERSINILPTLRGLHWKKQEARPRVNERENPGRFAPEVLNHTAD